MRVSLSKYANWSCTAEDCVTCTDGDVAVEVRQVNGGLVVVIQDAYVSLEPRAAGIWIDVRTKKEPRMPIRLGPNDFHKNGSRYTSGTGFVLQQAIEAAVAAEAPETTWLQKIEALAPGDACEFHYPARSQWLPGIVVVNGRAGYWTVRDESDVEGRNGKDVTAIHIEMIRLPGQEEAWQ